MPNLSIKSVPEALAESLRQRAARNHRSLQGELMAILEAAVVEVATSSVPSYTSGGDWRDRLRAPRQVAARRPGKDVEQIVAEMRRAHSEPRAMPSSTEIIRAMRDEHYGEAWAAQRVKDGPLSTDSRHAQEPGEA